MMFRQRSLMVLVLCWYTMAQAGEYQKHGMAFSYPENWYVSDESVWFSEPYVFLEADDSAIITINRFDRDPKKTLQDHAKAFSANAAASLILGSFKHQPIEKFSLNEVPVLKEMVELNVDFGEGLAVESELTRYYILLTSKQYDVLLILQADNEDFAAALPAYEQVNASFFID